MIEKPTTAEETYRQVMIIALARLSIERGEFSFAARDIARGLDGEAMFDYFRGPDVPQPFITCPVCGMTSYLKDDVVHRYCANCHKFHDDMTPDEIARATSESRKRGEIKPWSPRAVWLLAGCAVACHFAQYLGPPWPLPLRVVLDVAGLLFLVALFRPFLR